MCGGARRERARREGTEVVDARKRDLHEERHLDKLQRTPGTGGSGAMSANRGGATQLCDPLFFCRLR
jgi:hypothetical protein